jgi:hypothetical protein
VEPKEIAKMLVTGELSLWGVAPMWRGAASGDDSPFDALGYAAELIEALVRLAREGARDG